MNKIAINIFIFVVLLFNLTNAQQRLNKDNTIIFNKSVQTILDTGDSFLLSFDDDIDHIFLIYKFETNFIIIINEFTSDIAVINTETYKSKVTALKGTTTIFKQINEDTGEAIKEIPSHKFVIPLQKTDQLKTVIESLLLLKNNKSQPKLVFKSTGV